MEDFLWIRETYPQVIFTQRIFLEEKQDLDEVYKNLIAGEPIKIEK